MRNYNNKLKTENNIFNKNDINNALEKLSKIIDQDPTPNKKNNK